MKFYQFIKELKKLNPKANISLSDPRFSNTAFSTIYFDGRMDGLKLPVGFEYNEKNEITNKHHAKNGSYISIDVLPQSLNLSPLKPQTEHNAIVKETERIDKNVDWDYYAFMYELKRLNPSLKFDAQHASLSSTAMDTIYFTPTPGTDMNKTVNIPEGFIYDFDKKVFTNKNSTKSGNYINIYIKNTAKMKQDISNTYMTEIQLQKRYAQSPKLRPIFENLIPDVSQTTDKFALLYALQKLNPDAKLTFMHPAFSDSENMYFAEGFDLSKLKLPNGFEYNEKNGITNKNLTKSGAYISISLVQKDPNSSQIYYTDKQLKSEFQFSPDLQTVNFSSYGKEADPNIKRMY